MGYGSYPSLMEDRVLYFLIFGVFLALDFVTDRDKAAQHKSRICSSCITQMIFLNDH